MRRNRGASVVGFTLLSVVAALPATPHPLGNFSIDHYSRLRVTPQDLRVRYVIDMAEIPTFQELQDADADADRHVSAAEREAYFERTVKALAARLTATLNGAALEWRVESSYLTAPPDLVPPGEGTGPATLRVVLDLRAGFPAPLAAENHIRYEDGNYNGRTGWKEIVVEGVDGIRLLGYSGSHEDRSRELTHYPPGATAPPQDVTVEFTFATGARAGWPRALLARFREEDYLWLMVIAAALGLFARWRASRARGRLRAADCPRRP